jgi:hypothetical protein
MAAPDNQLRRPAPGTINPDGLHHGIAANEQIKAQSDTSQQTLEQPVPVPLPNFLTASAKVTAKRYGGDGASSQASVLLPLPSSKINGNNGVLYENALWCDNTMHPRGLKHTHTTDSKGAGCTQITWHLPKVIRFSSSNNLQAHLLSPLWSRQLAN